VLLSACLDSTGPPFPLIEATDFAPSLGIDLSEMTRIGGGVYVLDLEAGNGDALGPDRSVRISYSLYLADGTLVQERHDFRFRTSCLDVVAGLESGINGMRVDGRRRIIVPGRLGYGSRPPPGINVPFGAILVYVVEAHSSTLSGTDCPSGR
jgi:FKBP-type peptidyl-prolyl cis-trans isomerase